MSYYKFTLVIILCFLLQTSCQANVTFSVIHFNDFHARYGSSAFACNHCESKKIFHDVGGFSRLYSAIKRLSQERTNPIVLNAGDNFKGSLWFVYYSWNVTQYFLNKLPLDVITLGNHEFDNGLDDLVLFLKNIKTPVVVSNIDARNEQKMKNLFKKSVTITRAGRKIGIIGALTRETQLSSRTENVIFLNESASIYAEAQRLIQEEGVFTNIVLSHCGFDLDLEIARNSSFKISVVVGGHTDTFLFTGEDAPGPDKPQSRYPTVVYNRKGHPVLIVQASAYAKYLGNLTVNFDDAGHLVNWSGNPIFLDEQIPKDEAIDDDLIKWSDLVYLEGEKIIGESLFAMPDKICRSEECLLGNFVTDAMVFWYTGIGDDNNNSWTSGSVAMMHAGGIRNALPQGEISFKQLLTTFPFQDSIDLVEIRGEYLKEILEKTFDDAHMKSPHLLQVSGLHIVVNTSRAEGQRIVSLKTRCRKCETPFYEELAFDKIYRVILPGFLTDFEVINPLIKKYSKNKKRGPVDFEVYKNYLKKRSPVFSEIEGRIVFTE